MPDSTVSAEGRVPHTMDGHAFITCDEQDCEKCAEVRRWFDEDREWLFNA